MHAVKNDTQVCILLSSWNFLLHFNFAHSLLTFSHNIQLFQGDLINIKLLLILCHFFSPGLELNGALLPRLVSKNGNCRIQMKNVPYKKSLVSDIFTTAVEMSWRFVPWISDYFDKIPINICCRGVVQLGGLVSGYSWKVPLRFKACKSFLFSEGYC